jgi:RNA polymerase sigma-70 factor (ECF subfamily)
MILEAIIDWEQPVAPDSEIAKLRRRDPDVLAALVTRYQHRLYRYLLRLVRDPATAEDLFQQTWLRVAHGYFAATTTTRKPDSHHT